MAHTLTIVEPIWPILQNLSKTLSMFLVNHGAFHSLIHVPISIQYTYYPFHSALPPGRRFIAGSLAGTTATVVTYPFDMVRARMAVSRKQLYKGLVDTFRLIIRNEGVLTLYRGVSPTVIGVVPYAGCSFFIYETLKQKHRDMYNTELTPVLRLASGALAGLIGQTTSYPLDVVRRRMQTEGVVNNVKYQSIVGTMSYVFRTEGIRGMYKGVSMNWIKGPISVTVSFNVYDVVHEWITKLYR